MSQHDLVSRLITKRALQFVQRHDYTVLRNGNRSWTGNFDSEAEWLKVGTASEHRNKYVKLAEYLSYDEMMLASLLGSSGPTFFINTGSRKNCAIIDPTIPHQDRRIIVGLVGARFAREGQMDHALMLPPIRNETLHLRQEDPGVAKIFHDFFGGKPTGGKFNTQVYKARIQISIETLLLEADDRAAQVANTAYVHLVGLGLGVWALNRSVQCLMYVEVVMDCLEKLDLRYVSTLELAWITIPSQLRQKCVVVGKEAGVRILFNKRALCAKLETDELLVRSWAWDSNTLPGVSQALKPSIRMSYADICTGNEYWSGILDDSDDPAAACCSTIAELHNTYVNPFAHRTRVLQDRQRI